MVYKLCLLCSLSTLEHLLEAQTTLTTPCSVMQLTEKVLPRAAGFAHTHVGRCVGEYEQGRYI